MSNNPPPPGPGGQPLPPGLDPDAFTPFGTGPDQGSTPPSSVPSANSPQGSGGDALPAHEITDPNLGADEPTVADTPSPDSAEATVKDEPQGLYQSEIKPGSPYPTEPSPSESAEQTITAGPADQGQSTGQPSQDQQTGQANLADHDMADGQDGGYDGGDLPPYGSDRYGYPDHHPEQPNKANAMLILLSGVLSAIILAGGGYIWFAQNQAAKTNSQRAVEAAQSEAKVAQAEAQKAHEEAKKALEEAKRQAEEATKKASEAAAKATAAPTAPTSGAPVAPAPTARPTSPPAAKPQPAPTKDRGTPLGNGCTPGDNQLSDGTWYAYVWDEDDGIVSFDLVCYYADGSVTNDNKKIRSLPSSTDWDPEGGLIGFDVSGGVIVNMWHV